MLELKQVLEGFAMNKQMTQEEKQQAYDAWFIAEVDKGIAAVESGDVLTDEQATLEMNVFMAELHQKYGPKAA